MYKLRLKNYRILGPLSRKEVLERIKRGKLSGKESLSQSPFDTWEPISSYPEFYDALMKQLFDEGYQKGEKVDKANPKEAPTHWNQKAHEEKEDKPSSKTSQKTTQYGTVGHSIHVGEHTAHGKTRQIEQGGEGEIDKIEDSEIRELFDSDTGVSESVLPESSGEKKAESTALSILSQDLEETVEPQEGGLLLGEDPPSENAPEENQTGSLLSRLDKKKVALVTVLVLGLYVLTLEDAPQDSPAASKVTLEQSLPPLLEQSSVSHDNRMSILIRDGEQFLRADIKSSYHFIVSHYEAYLSYFEKSTDLLGIYLEAATSLLFYGDKDEALKAKIVDHLERGRRLDPHSSAFYRAEASLLMSEGKLDSVRELLLKAVESDPSNARNALLLGEYSYLTKNYPEASQLLTQAIQGDAGLIRAYYLLAQVHVAMGNMTEAEKILGQVTSYNPLHSRAYFLLAEIHRQRNQLKAAEKLYLSAANLASFTSQSQAASTFLRLATLQEVLQKNTQAEKSYSLAYYYETNPSEELKRKVQGLDTSKDWLTRLHSQQVYNVEFFLSRGRSFFIEKKFSQAASYFQAANLLDDEGGRTTFRLAESLEKLAVSYEDFNKVAMLYERTLQESPGLYLAYVRLGELETQRYNLDRALSLLLEAQRRAPKKFRVYLALGKHFYQRKDYRKSQENFAKVQLLEPNHSETLYYTGMLLLQVRRGKTKEAETYFYNAFLTDPSNAKALVEWGKMKVQLFEKTVAVKFLNGLIEKDPNNPDNYWALGEIYAANQEHERAINQYHLALDRDNRRGDIRMALAQSLVQKGEVKKAIAEFRLASVLDRRNVEGLYKASELLILSKDYEEALKVLKDLVQITPKYPGANFGLARIYRYFNEEQKAIDTMKVEVESNPQNPKFRLELAQLYMEYRQYEEAIAALSKVVALPDVMSAPQFAEDKVRAYLLLSRCYRAQEKFESARGAIGLALQFDPNDQVLHLEKGRVYLGLHRDKEAALAFREYLKRAPAGQEANKVRSWLQKIEVPE